MSKLEPMLENIKTSVHLAAFTQQGKGVTEFYDLQKIIDTLHECAEFIRAEQEKLKKESAHD